MAWLLPGLTVQVVFRHVHGHDAHRGGETGRERGVSAQGFPQGRQDCWAVWPVKEKPDPRIYYEQFLDF